MTYQECVSLKSDVLEKVPIEKRNGFELHVVPKNTEHRKLYLDEFRENWVDEDSIPFATDGDFELRWLLSDGINVIQVQAIIDGQINI